MHAHMCMHVTLWFMVSLGTQWKMCICCVCVRVCVYVCVHVCVIKGGGGGARGCNKGAFIYNLLSLSKTGLVGN